AAPADLHAALSPAAVGRAFGQALLQQAHDEVAMEAGRAGHGNSFRALPNLVQTAADDDAIASLSRVLGPSPASLHTALRRLRRRLRQRIDAALALWADGPEARQALRRSLHAALLIEESTP